MASKKGKAITFNTTDEIVEAMDEWQKLLGFSSRRQMAEHLVTMGMMAMEMVAGHPLTADGFANALYTTGSHFIQATYGRDRIQKTVQEFKAWQNLKTKASRQDRTLGRGRVLVKPRRRS